MIRCRTVAASRSERSIVFVHAHPDDEVIGTGGTIAHYAALGAHVCVVTCTNGELGEVAEVPDLGPVEEIRQRLGEIRREELAEACRLLGDVDLRLLGFHDSGMEGTPDNDDPRVFVNQDPDEAVRKVVEIYRELRPQVVVTYNEYGFYGHPDHIRAHEVALWAADAAADPRYRRELGEPHSVAKIYYTAIPKSLLRRGREVWGDDEFMSEEVIERIGTDDEHVAVILDVSAYIDRKFEALRAHRTQLGTTEQFLSLAEDLRVVAFGTECYVLARPQGSAAVVEDDLFAGT